MVFSIFSICSVFTWTIGFFLIEILFTGILSLNEYNSVDPTQNKPLLFWFHFLWTVIMILLLIAYWTRKRATYLSLIGFIIFVTFLKVAAIIILIVLLIRKINGETMFILPDTDFDEFQEKSFWYIIEYILDTSWTVMILSFIWISYRTDYPKVKPIL